MFVKCVFDLINRVLMFLFKLHSNRISLKQTPLVPSIHVDVCSYMAVVSSFTAFEELRFLFFFMLSPNTSIGQDLVNPLDAISSLAHNITFLCKRLDAKIQVASVENGEIPLSGPSDDSHDMSRICSVLNTAITEGHQDVTVTMLVALQTLMRQVCAGWAKPDVSDVSKTRLLLWKLICAPADSVGAEVQLETCNVLKAGLEVFYPTTVDRSALFMLLLSEGDSTPGMAQLLDILLIHLADSILNSDPGVSLKGR